MFYTYEELKPLLRLRGRTVEDPERGGLYINWSTCGFDVRFSGKKLLGRFEAVGNVNRMDPSMPVEYPCLAVFDEEERMLHRMMLKEEDALVTLFEQENAQECTLQVIKLTEDSRGKIRLVGLETDGEILPLKERGPRPMVEIVGDSITCGYGNEAKDPSEHFDPETENGWEAYGPRACREIGADWSVVAASGIAVAGWAGAPAGFGPPHFSMEEQYAYTDRSVSDLRSLPNPEWDFKTHKNDVVVINLGTNDASQVAFSPNREEAEKRFREHYGAFLREVRRLNGPDTWILCTLGPMDYYLLDEIRDLVKAYQEETGDERISFYKFGHVHMMMEGYGADMHPSLKTHERMGRELAAVLGKILEP